MSNEICEEMKIFEKYLLPQYILPTLVALTVGMGAWTWGISQDVVVLKEKTSEVSQLKSSMQAVQIDLARVDTKISALQEAQKASLETIRREIRLVIDRNPN